MEDLENPNTLLSLMPLVIDPFKLLKVIRDALIEYRFLRKAGAI